MIFFQLNIGGDRNFAYIIGDPDSHRAVVVDPGTNPEMILDRARRADLRITYILNTHSHWDHIGANGDIAAATGAPVYGFNESVSDETLFDGQILNIGALALKIIHTPGHTPDSACILAGDKLCTGDTLFVGKVGGTGFGDDAAQEYHSLHKKIMTLPGDTGIYPGHDYGMTPSSTVAREKQTNPFILQPDFDAFVHLKKNWAAYKKKHGIK